MPDVCIGYAVFADGAGYVEDLCTRTRRVWFCPDWRESLLMGKFRDAQVVQGWVLNALPKVGVTIFPFLLNSVLEIVQ